MTLAEAEECHFLSWLYEWADTGWPGALRLAAAHLRVRRNILRDWRAGKVGA